MKKLLVLGLVLGLAVSAVGCGNDNVEASGGDETKVEENVETSNDEVATGIELNGQMVQIGMDITEDVISKIGTPLEEIEAPSCHYDGNDTIYVYEDFTLYVYQNGEENNLYIAELTTENAETPEGAKIGMTKDEVVAIYGEDYTHEGVIVSFEEENYKVDFSVDESNVVTLIEILEK